MADFETLKKDIDAIQNATVVGENTAGRIGGVFAELAELMPREQYLSLAEYNGLDKKDDAITYYVYEEES